MRASMLNAALVVVVLSAVSEATRMSQRSKAFLAAGEKVDAQQKSHLASMELGRLQTQTNEMYSVIEEVQNLFEEALVELGHVAERQPANASNSTKVPSKEEAAKKVEAVHVNSTNSTKVPSKEEATKKVVQPVKSATNKSSVAVAAVGTKGKVRKIVSTQQSILEKLFKHLKGNIVNLNKEESSAKDVSAKAVERLQARLNKEKMELKKKNLSAFEHEELVNRTRTDNFELQYWTRDRSLGHQMFHSNLKMTHGLMSRVKSVIAACKEAVTKGRVDKDMMKKVREQALPKVFLEMRSSLKHKAQRYYAHVLTARWGVAAGGEAE